MKNAITKVIITPSSSVVKCMLIWKTVIEQCCLKPDLSLFEAGDLTEIGEKGLTLRYVAQ